MLDEADVGIGGTTADTVGRLLRQLADHTQILCVTHAPQVAALGQHHLSVAKGAEHDTQIVYLDREHRVDELARMLLDRFRSQNDTEAFALLAELTQERLAHCGPPSHHTCG